MFTEDWGEQEVGIKNPVAVVLDLSTEICSVLTTGEYADISVGQVGVYKRLLHQYNYVIIFFRLFGVRMN